MPRRLFLALLLLVAAPMVLLGWMSASAVKANQSAAKESLATLLSSQLTDADQRIAQLFEGYATELDDELNSPEPVFQTLRRMRRTNPIMRQGIVVDSSGVMVYPRPDDLVGIDAAEVAASLPGMIDARPLPTSKSDSKAALNPVQQMQMPAKGQTLELTPPSPLQVPNMSNIGFADPVFVDSAWQQWYMADGAQVVYWRARSDGMTVGILLERSRWIADLIATLPDQRIAIPASQSSPTTVRGLNINIPERAPTPIGSISLVDEAKRPVYLWGKADQIRLPPLVSSQLSPPLASWQLRLHVDRSLIPTSSPIPMYLSLGGIALVFLAVGFYVLTAVQRQISEAKSRVSFAGQVSHELRTPLTNIRLYTELAESDLHRVQDNDAADSLARRLRVIDHESRRLQRLVSGVLEMIRPSGKQIGVRSEPTDLCALITGIAQQFAPSFDAAELSLETHCDCQEPITIDPDVVEMVLVNLLSNVEKYVPRGGKCSLTCDVVHEPLQSTRKLRIIVADDGPGIAAKHRIKVFRPFQRIDDSINAPSGTGIGLTIARRAATRHGGELILLPTSHLGGAAFELTIPIADKSSS